MNDWANTSHLAELHAENQALFARLKKAEAALCHFRADETDRLAAIAANDEPTLWPPGYPSLPLHLHGLAEALLQGATILPMAEKPSNSAEYLLTALEISRTFAFEWEPASDRVRRSQGCTAILGIPDEEAQLDTGERSFQRIHPGDRRLFGALLDNLRPEADRYRTEYRLIRADGSELLMLESGQAFFDSDGRFQRLVGTTTDITAQKPSTGKEHQRDVQFRQMAEAVGEVFWQSSPDRQTIFYISPAFEQIWGRKCENLLNDPMLWMETILPDDMPRFLGGMQDLAYRGQYDVEFRIVRPDGQLRWINDRGFATRDAAGRVYLGSGIATDITRRKQMEEALRQSDARFRNLFELSADALLLSDERGFLDCNEAALRLFGCASREEFLDQPAHRFWPAIQPGGKESQALIREHIAAAMNDSSRHFNWQHRRFDGTEFAAEVVLSRVEHEGRPVLLGIVRAVGEHTSRAGTDPARG